MKLLIENLRSGITSEDLNCLLSDLSGFVSSLIKFDQNGESMGIGIVQFESIPTAQFALQKYNGYSMHGAPIRISKLPK